MTHPPLNTRGADIALSIENVLTRLTDCLNRETEAIIRNDRAGAARMAEEKIRLMEQYRGLSESIDRDRSIFESLDETIRAHLRAISADFQTALHANLEAIRSAHGAVTRLMDRIMTAARRTAMQGRQRYDASGALTGGHAGGGVMPTKFNEEL